MAAGKKLRDWSLRCPDTAGHVFNTQHQDMWKIITLSVSWMKPLGSTEQPLFGFPTWDEMRNWQSTFQPFGTGWSFVTCTVFKAVKQWTAFFTNNIFDDLQ